MVPMDGAGDLRGRRMTIKCHDAYALAKAIKESYRRLEYGSNSIRIGQETDRLIDRLAALASEPPPAQDEPPEMDPYWG